MHITNPLSSLAGSGLPLPRAIRLCAWPLLMLTYLGVASIAAPPSGDQKASPAEIRKLLAASGADKSLGEADRQIIDTLRARRKDFPDERWQEAREQIDRAALTGRIEAAYARHLSREDVAALIAFYETPAGKRIAGAQPGLSKEIAAAVTEWTVEQTRKAQKVLSRQEGKTQ